MSPGLLLPLLLMCPAAEASQAPRRPREEWFEEELTVRPLHSGGLLLYANLSVAILGRNWRQLELFPNAVTELLLATDAAEVHLSLSSGRWLEEWGTPPEPAPAGAAAWAWVPTAKGRESWRLVLEALSSLLCARGGWLAESGEAGAESGDGEGSGDGESGNGGESGVGGVGARSVTTGRAAGTVPSFEVHPYRRMESSVRALRSMRTTLGPHSGANEDLMRTSLGPHCGAAASGSTQQALSPPHPNKATGRIYPNQATWRLYHATDPRQGVCTENVGSWLDLSPCQDVAGVGEVLRSRGDALEDDDDEPRGAHSGGGGGGGKEREPGVGRHIVADSRFTSLRFRVVTECAPDTAPDRAQTGAVSGSASGGASGGASRCRPQTRLALGLTAVLPGRAETASVASDAKATLGGAAAVSASGKPRQAVYWLSRILGADRLHADRLHADRLHADRLHADRLHADRLHADVARRQGLHACPLARHSVFRLELAGATPTAHEAALGAISAAGVPPLRVWPSAYAPEEQLQNGGLVRAVWTLPPPAIKCSQRRPSHRYVPSGRYPPPKPSR